MRAAARVANGLPRRRLPRAARLRRRAEFQRVYVEGSRAAGRYVVLFARPGEQAHSRVGVTASRKIGNAVARSRCKRRLRELFRMYWIEIENKPMDCVINARRDCATAPWPELRREFERAARRLRQRLGGE